VVAAAVVVAAVAVGVLRGAVPNLRRVLPSLRAVVAVVVVVAAVVAVASRRARLVKSNPSLCLFVTQVPRRLASCPLCALLHGA
jgi:hypothetical protein